MADAITIKALQDASLDAKSLEEVVNGDEAKQVTTRKGETYPSVKKAINTMFENGGLPATPFATKALMTASALVDGKYAMVTDDTDNNGLYVKTAGAWVKSNYDPFTQAKKYSDEVSALTTAQYIGELLPTFTTLNGKALGGNKNSNNTGLLDRPDAITYVFDSTSRKDFYVNATGITNRVRVATFTNDTLTNGNLIVDNTTDTSTAIIAPAGTVKIAVSLTTATDKKGLTVSYGDKPYTPTVTAINQINERIDSLPLDTVSIFESGAAALSFKPFNIPGAIKHVVFWGLPENEQVYLRTLWNRYNYPTGSTTDSSIGFNSSSNYHITVGLAKQSDINVYAKWTVTERLTGVQTYLLYKNGDNTTPALGSVTVDWDLVSSDARFIDTTNTSKLNDAAVKPPELYYLNNKKSESDDNNYYTGKKIGAIGDSITWGFRPRNDVDGTTGQQMNSWLALTAQSLGMTAYNFGISGSTLAAKNGLNDSNSMTRRYDLMPDDLDVICVMGGTNDVRKGVPIGTIEDRTDSTYYGALHVICLGLIDKYYNTESLEIGKKKQIVLMTPIKMIRSVGDLDTMVASFAQAVRDVAEYYSLPVIDMYRYSGINPHIQQTVQGNEEGYMGVYNRYITDGVHPTQQGQYKMARVSTGALKTMV